MIEALIIGILIEHPTERIKEYLAGFLARKGRKVYIAHWIAPLIAFLLSWGILWPLTGSLAVFPALLATATATVWYEVSHVWKKRKRENVPIHTDGLNLSS